MARCNTCDTPRKINSFGELDCPKCNSGNFVGFSKKEKVVGIFGSRRSNDIIDNPVFVKGEGIEVLVESEE